jgi:VCBS repeat protein/FG-GAP repeat protein/BACON domain-containing protein
MMVARILGAGLLLVLTSAPAAAQTVSLTEADPIGLGAAGSKTGTWLDQGALGGGDSRRDLVVGAPGGGSVKGAVHIQFGGPVRTGEFNYPTSSEVTITSLENNDQFGRSSAAGNILATTGSRNLVVGAPGAEAGRGRVYLFTANFTGGTSFTTANAVFIVRGAPGDALGTSLATADLNGDGYREIIIGAAGSNRAYIINGGPGLVGTHDLQTTPARVVMSGPAIGDTLAAGDVTGDGLGDLFVGCPSTNTVYLLAGRPGDAFAPSLNLATDADAVFTGASAGDRAGAAIALPDLNADNVQDLVISAPNADGPSEGRAEGGEAYVIWGGAPLTSRSLANADVTIYGAGPGHLLGSVMSYGDVNRDAPNDLVFLSPGASAAGDLYVYYGRRKDRFGTAVAGGQRIVDLADGGVPNRRIVGDPAHGAIGGVIVFEVTGEGSRDILAGVPTSGSNAGRVFFSISPRLRLSPGTMSMYVQEGTRLNGSINITNPSTIPIGYSAASNRPWLTLGTAAGNVAVGSPARLDFSVDGSALTPGTYSARVTVTSTSFDVEMFLPLELTVVITSTRIQIYSPAENASVRQPFTLSGWSADLTAPTGTGVNGIRIYADPNPGSGAPRMFLGDAAYGNPRPDVAAAYGARFEHSGFTYSVSNLPSGRYRFLIFARNAASNTYNAFREYTLNLTNPTSPADFSGDGRADLIWQHQTGGWISAWKMNGATLTDAVLLNPSQVTDVDWKIVGTGDFNADGRPDLLWQHRARGLLSVWFMNGTTMIDAVLLNPSTVPDPNWRIVAVADINRDGKPDLVWYHQVSGQISTWLMNGTSLIDAVNFSPGGVSDTTWRLVAAGDVNGDGNADLIWRHTGAGLVSAWLMNGTSLIDAVYLNPDRLATAWQFRSFTDLDGDGHLDIVWQHNDGSLLVWFLENTTRRQAVSLNPAQVPDSNWVIAGPR